MPKQPSTLSVLFVSDRWKEPWSLKIRFSTLRVLGIGGVMLLAVLVIGGVQFYQMVERTSDYEVLRANSLNVEVERQHIRSIAMKLDGIMRRDAQLRNLLGAKIDVEAHELMAPDGALKAWDDIAALDLPDAANAFDPLADSEAAIAELQHLPSTLPTQGDITPGV